MQKSHLHIAVRRSGAFLSDSFRYEAFGKSFKTRGSLRPSQFGKISKRLSLFMVFIAFPIRKSSRLRLHAFGWPPIEL